MGFDAAEAVPKLEWDFTKYGGGSGISPEPSTEMLLEFNVQSRNLMDGFVRIKKAKAIQEIEKLNGRSHEDKMAEVNRWADMGWQEAAEAAFQELALIAPTKEGIEIAHQQAILVAQVFADCPSVEQIEKLPGRVKAAYFGWVAGQLINPESEAVVTN
jgi:hypothetical protein